MFRAGPQVDNDGSSGITIFPSLVEVGSEINPSAISGIVISPSVFHQPENSLECIGVAEGLFPWADCIPDPFGGWIFRTPDYRFPEAYDIQNVRSRETRFRNGFIGKWRNGLQNRIYPNSTNSTKQEHEKDFRVDESSNPVILQNGFLYFSTKTLSTDGTV